MTLIVASRCREGAVFTADTQTTSGDFRSQVKKLIPRRMGQFQVLVAGSGLVDLVKNFTERLAERLEEDSSDSLKHFKTVFDSELNNFRRNEVPLDPAPKKDKNLSFLVAAVSSSGYEAWCCRNGGRLCVISDYELIGHDHDLYYSAMRRVWSESLGCPQSILAQVHVLTIAEQTSNYVKRPFSVCIVDETGIYLESETYVQLLADRLLDYERDVNSLLLACADSGLYLSQLEQLLKDFCERARKFHKLHLSHVVDAFVESGELYNANVGHRRVPPGFTMSLLAGDMDDVYTEAEKKKLMEQITIESRRRFPDTFKPITQQDPESTTRDPSSPPPLPESPGGFGES